MSVSRGVVCLLVTTCLWTAAVVSGETVLSCVVMETCLLPCSFQPGDEELIHWIQVSANDAPVHAFYHRGDHFDHQDPRFKGRTSLSHDGISTGNASLQLRGLQVQDQGRYKCYTSTTWGNQETFITLKVQAPVSGVDIEQEGNTITCRSSAGIYPEPGLSWSSRPQTPLSLHTSLQRTPQELFIITSTLTLNQSAGDLVYFCKISSQESSSSATVLQLPPISGSSHTDASIPCSTSDPDLRPSKLTWRFNHTDIILTQTNGQVQDLDLKKWDVKVSSSGSLILTASSVEHVGIFTCERKTAQGTLVYNTFVKIRPQEGNQTHEPGSVAGIVVGTVAGVALGVVGIVVLVIYCKRPNGVL
ncbi:butyrophilin subfamily 1 member A1-like [Genypterus blacodes]|uniref:butyrophilin subfamily 1 member A1-like n=1 Tax=Genypterus blacodes TaxID=154954 RepID=UPI003F772419